jgi:hypothetical protein
MRKSAFFLLILICLVTCVSVVQADQPLPFAPLGNVTGEYVYNYGEDIWEIGTNFPLSSQDVVYPEWLFGMMIVFVIITIYFSLIFMSREPAAWVSVIACGILIFGLGLSAALMAPLVGYTEVFSDVLHATQIKGNNTVYVNEIIVYTMGPWTAYAGYGIAVGGLIIVIAGFLLQTKAARKIANDVQQEKIMGGEIDFRNKERRGR